MDVRSVHGTGVLSLPPIHRPLYTMKFYQKQDLRLVLVTLDEMGHRWL